MRKRNLGMLTGLVFLAISFASAPRNASAARGPDCNRDCLISFVDRCLEAIVKHDYRMLPLTDSVKYTENGEVEKPGEGIWKTAVGIRYKQYFADPSTGQSALFGVLDEGNQLAIFALRLKVEGKKIAEIETIVAHKGDHALFAPEALVAAEKGDDHILPPSERTTREKMIAAANSYFDGIEQHNGEIVPFSQNCNRIENGIQTTNNPGRFNSSCRDGLKTLVYIPAVRDRRFPIVDEERGLVLSFIVFDMPGTMTTAVIDGKTVELSESQRRKRSLLLAEVFRIVYGQIVDIRAFMVNRQLGAPSGWK